jgi:hypothetical protein
VRVCEIPDCGRKHSIKGLCALHYRSLPEQKAKQRERDRRRRADPGRRERKDAKTLLWYLSPRGRFRNLKVNAANKGREVSLNFEEFISITSLPCHYCGGFNQGRAADSGLVFCGLDRRDNARGYTLQNVLPCCSWCNRMKFEFSYEEFLEKVKAIYRIHHAK